jgi:hypothetical protein
MSQLVGGVVLHVVEVEHDVDGDRQDEDEEGEDVNVDGEALGGHVTGKQLDPGQQGQRDDGEDLRDFGDAKPKQKRHSLHKMERKLIEVAIS